MNTNITPNILESLIQLSKLISPSNHVPSQSTSQTKEQLNLIELINALNTLKLEDSSLKDSNSSLSANISNSQQAGQQPLSKLIIELSTSKNQQLQQKFEVLCSQLEALVEWLPQLLSVFASLQLLQGHLNNSFNGLMKTFADVRKLFQEESTKISCIEKRIKDVKPLKPLNIALINQEQSTKIPSSYQFMTPQYKPENKFIFEPRDVQNTAFVQSFDESDQSSEFEMEEQPAKQDRAPVICLFNIMFTEIRHQKLGITVLRSEELATFSDLEVIHLIFLHSQTERSGLLINGSQGNAVLVISTKEFCNSLKACVKLQGEFYVEKNLVYIMNHNQVYRADIRELSTAKIYLTPLKKI